jgi:FOG: CheY-like receiver
MRIHYVEDNDNDAELFSRMVREENGVEILVSSRLEDFEKSGSREQTDFVMLDVYRPDAVSIEDDIRRIRAFTDAPIVLVTSDGSDSVRRQAFEGGAEAVLDKGDMNPKLIRQIARNSTLRHKITTEIRLEDAMPVIEPRVSSEDMKSNLSSLQSAFSYIEYSLQTLFEAMQDAGRENSAEYIRHLVDTVKAIRAYSQDDLSQATRTPIHELMMGTAQHVSQDARQRGIDLIFEAESSWFTQMGSRPLAALGLNHLIGGLLRACSKGDRVSVRSERDDNGIALNIFLSRVVLNSVDALFNMDAANPTMGFDAKASVQLGLTLLSVPKEQVDVHVHRNNLFIKIKI